MTAAAGALSEMRIEVFASMRPWRVVVTGVGRELFFRGVEVAFARGIEVAFDVSVDACVSLAGGTDAVDSGVLDALAGARDPTADGSSCDFDASGWESATAAGVVAVWSLDPHQITAKRAAITPTAPAQRHGSHSLGGERFACGFASAGTLGVWFSRVSSHASMDDGRFERDHASALVSAAFCRGARPSIGVTSIARSRASFADVRLNGCRPANIS
jgi:hypothetical protein